ncbi:hypothetical protein [Microbacterium hominis]|uniref:Uncharacterized protein n=1 Tax=Microbacterium hominis TaxID=162426 RepID=A0A2K9D986_9MICO|nr:hypothetical protein [Microbacterium hominis]AUG29442.1 hypothetical protein CXR34_08180 [Microbacterium hominis]
MSTRRTQPQSAYPPYEVQHQQKERARWMMLARPDWTLTVEDAQFSHDFLGSPVPLSGDLRPTDIHPQPKELTA